MSVLRPELVRTNEIRRQRDRAARVGIWSTVLQAQALFWAWTIGWILGPAPLRTTELAAGALFTFTVGALISWPFNRRRVEWGSTWIGKVREGNRRRRVVVFDDYVTVDHDIILRAAVRDVDVDDDTLQIRYEEAVDGSIRLRTLTGAPDTLRGLRDAIA